MPRERFLAGPSSHRIDESLGAGRWAGSRFWAGSVGGGGRRIDLENGGFGPEAVDARRSGGGGMDSVFAQVFREGQESGVEVRSRVQIVASRDGIDRRCVFERHRPSRSGCVRGWRLGDDGFHAAGFRRIDDGLDVSRKVGDSVDPVGQCVVCSELDRQEMAWGSQIQVARDVRGHERARNAMDAPADDGGGATGQAARDDVLEGGIWFQRAERHLGDACSQEKPGIAESIRCVEDLDFVPSRRVYPHGFPFYPGAIGEGNDVRSTGHEVAFDGQFLVPGAILAVGRVRGGQEPVAGAWARASCAGASHRQRVGPVFVLGVPCRSDELRAHADLDRDPIVRLVDRRGR